MNTFDEIVFLGKYLGSRLDISQAGGGNISIKEGGSLIIKSSGFSLSELSAINGLSIVKDKKIQSLIQNLDNLNSGELGKRLEETVDSNSKRPSIETPLHGIIKDRVVVHVHPIAVLAMASALNGKEICEEILPDAMWVDYATPGKDLAIKFNESYLNDPMKQIFILKNHGIIISSSTASEAISLLETTLRKIEEKIGFESSNYRIISKIQKEYFEVFGEYKSVYEVKNVDFYQGYNLVKDSFSIICPDDVVYFGADIPRVKNGLSLTFKEIKANNKTPPVVIEFDDKLYILSTNTSKCHQIYEQLYGSVIAQSKVNSIDPLSIEEVNFLQDWEAEKYRQKVKG